MSAVLNKENLLKEINYRLTIVEVSTRNLGFQNLFDQNIICEDFFAGLLNTAFGWQLELLAKHQTAVDLIDQSTQMLFQVTASRERKKIQSTIDKFSKKYNEPSLYKLRFLIIGQRRKYRIPFNVPSQITFGYQDDIWDMPLLLDRFRRLDTNALQLIAKYMNHEMVATPTSADKVRSERLRIYDAFKTFFKNIASADKNEDKGAIISQFKIDTDLLPFLGMPDVEALRSDLVSKAWNLQRLEDRLNGRESQIPGDKFRQWTSEEANLINWFYGQKKGLVDVFRPYLSI